MPALLDGGAEKVLVDTLRNFDYNRYDVTLFLEFKEGPYLNDIPEEVELLALHGRNNLWFQRLHRRLLMYHCYAYFHEIVYRLAFLLILKGRNFDTIVSFMEGAAVKFHSYIYQKAKCNLSWVHIDLKKKHWSLDFFRNQEDEWKAYQKMDYVIFVSDDARINFKKIFPISEERCKVLYNIIDSSDIIQKSSELNVYKLKTTICMVGRLNSQKRYDRAIEVAKKLKETGYDVDFWILGAGSLESELKEQAKKCGVENSFLFKGFVKPPYAYMKQADFFLCTSEAEGLPVVICEAFCLGIPVVATDITGPRELLTKSEAGLLVDEDIESIYQGVVKMIENEGFRRKCAQKALKFAETFSVNATMERIYNLMQ